MAGLIQDVKQLFNELHEMSDWFSFGASIGVPMRALLALKHSKNSEQQNLVEMLHHWLTSTPSASWKHVVSSLEKLDELVLASKLKKKFIMNQSEGSVPSHWCVTVHLLTIPLSQLLTTLAVIRPHPHPLILVPLPHS